MKKKKKSENSAAPISIIIIMYYFAIFVVRRCADTSIKLINALADKCNTIKINHFLIQHSYFVYAFYTI